MVLRKFLHTPTIPTLVKISYFNSLDLFIGCAFLLEIAYSIQDALSISLSIKHKLFLQDWPHIR